MSEPKQIENGDQALMKENALLKQALEELRYRERETTAQLKAHEDISQLLVAGMYSDVTISVGGKNFAAHRAILSARSPFFADLLEKNQQENCLMINDVPVGVFEVLLNFIYTGNVPSLELQMAKDLLIVADKYKLEQLKSLVEENLCVQWSFESVVSLLSVAKAVNAPKLKKCLELLTSHATSSTTRLIASLPPFARLPDLCLLALFHQLPPADQMSARSTCHRWSTLVPVVNRRHPPSLTLSFTRFHDDSEYQINLLSHGSDWSFLKSLQIENGSSIRSLTKWNRLHFKDLNEETISQIMTTFPVIKDLQLYVDISLTDNEVHCDCCPGTTPSPDFLVRLLEQWHPQLTKLNLIVDITSPSGHLLKPSLDRLVTAINSLSTLKHLSIKLHLNHEPFPFDLPILSQLIEFNSYLPFPKFSDLFHRNVSENSQLTQIRFRRNNSISIQSLASLSPDLRRRIVYFYSDYHNNPILHSDYRTICNLFPSLNRVDLKLSTATTLRDFFTHASQLTQLVDLQLSIDFTILQPDDQPHRPLPQLTSVKLFRLFLKSMQDHHNLEPLNLAWTMPNLQVIKLGIDSHQCTTCGISNWCNQYSQTKHCLRQIFTTLKRTCTRLHTIKHNFEERLGTAEKILAAKG